MPSAALAYESQSALHERIRELEAVIREQEVTIQRTDAARALAVQRIKALQRTLRNRRTRGRP